jgi:pimeloyl-ACP methyl ester carboxylesterase
MSQYIEFRSQNVHYTDAGEGPVIVLVHGFTESLAIWKPFSEELSKSFRVICLDLPGHGRTANFEAMHSMEFMAEVVHAVLSFCRIQKCVLVGHSMGGYVALAFAHLYPEMLKGLVLFHSQADADNEEARQNRDRTIEIVRQDRFGFINQFIPDLFAPANRERLGREIEVLKNQAGSISGKGLVAALEGMKVRNGWRDLLQSLTIPVLFIAGKQDTRIPIDKVIEQIALPKHAEALLLEGVGHMGYLEAAEITLGVISDFTKRINKA